MTKFIALLIESENIDWTLFWTAFGAIGSTVGTIITAVAVIIALWQTKYPYKKNLKLSFSDCTRVGIGDKMDFPVLISLDVSNIGNRDIYIQEWGFIIKNKERVIFFNQVVSNKFPVQMRSSLFPALPIHLPVEKAISLHFEQQTFLDTILECRKQKKLKDYQKIRIYVTDSGGKRYLTKSKENVKLLCEKYQSKNIQNRGER